jgi:hypothetical protein
MRTAARAHADTCPQAFEDALNPTSEQGMECAMLVLSSGPSDARGRTRRTSRGVAEGPPSVDAAATASPSDAASIWSSARSRPLQFNNFKPLDPKSLEHLLAHA